MKNDSINNDKVKIVIEKRKDGGYLVILKQKKNN